MSTIVIVGGYAIVFLLLFTQSLAKTVTYDFNLTWVMANPDGLATRKVIGVNGSWPLPVIEVDKGDRLVVNMLNSIDRDASIHFHGMFQNGTNYMDGPSMVTQCPVPPGSSITYNFTVEQNGTYWYHCHTDFCYPDGYRQALLVHDPDAFFIDLYDDEYTITISDWYHKMTEDIAPEFLSLYNPTGAEPIPDAFLFNDTMNSTLPVEPGKTYLFRLINTAAFTAQYFYIEDHSFQIVEVDGVYTEPQEASTLYIAVAQRYSILVTMKNSTDRNYGIVTIADQVLFDVIPANLQLNQTNWLLYNSSAPLDTIIPTLDVVDTLPAFDDFDLIPYDHMPLLPDPDYTIQVAVIMLELNNGLPYAFLDNITYRAPKVPSLYTVLSAGNLSAESIVYGEYTHPFVLNHLDVVEVIINNNDGGTHPFHLHGHNFQVINRTPAYGDDFYTYGNLPAPVSYDPNNHTSFPQYPIRRDVVVLPPQGSLVIRFVADNPGVWFFHCHIDWHLSQGLASVFIEAPQQMQERLTIPEDHLAVCRAAGVAIEGNAAANTEDYLDLTGQNTQPGFIPYGGFTTKGIVAMVFSVIAAIIGAIAITVYGLSEPIYADKENDGSLQETSVSTKGDERVQTVPVRIQVEK